MSSPTRVAVVLWIVGTLPGMFAYGDDPDNAPFDGEWSLELRVNTRPGGASFTTTQGMAVAPYNFHFNAPIESFRFQNHRSVKLAQRAGTSLGIQSTGRFGEVIVKDNQNHQGRIHVEGEGSGEAEDRKLKLTCRWGLSSGTGVATDNFGTSQSYRAQMSEDGTQITLANEAGTRTLKFDLWKSDWELTPTSIEEREISEDVIEERTIYRGRREVRLTPLDPGGFSPALPVTEEIELKQIRQLKLIPRG